MNEIKNEFIRIKKNNFIYYGGNQGESEKSDIKICGCGIVAAADTIIYLRSGEKNSPPLPIEKYNRFLLYLNKNYFPLIPKLGMNALGLTIGLNLYFRKRKMPYTARWLASGEKLFEEIEQQLRNDIPVILSVGPNFPLVWQKHTLNLYTKSGNEYIKTASAKAHFVTVTGIDEKFMRISSWGRELYIEKTEFMEYMKAHSNSLLCNMLQIKKR